MLIEIVGALIFDVEDRLVTLSKRGAQCFMLRGGKPQPGEDVPQDLSASSGVAGLMNTKGSSMKLMLAATACAALALAVPPAAEAKGCLKGAAVGGVAGHFMGHHPVAGAAVGCAVGHHQAKKKARQVQAAQTQPPAPQPKR